MAAHGLAMAKRQADCLRARQKQDARKSARGSKNFAEADRIRKELETAGVILEDGKGGTTWKYKE